MSDPRDRPAAGSPDTVIRPSTDPERWRAYWYEHGPDFKPELRYRRGLPASTAVALDELDGRLASAAERRMLHHELVVRSGRYLPFDPRDFVPAQEQALAEWRPVAQAAASPGSWQRAARRG